MPTPAVEHPNFVFFTTEKGGLFFVFVFGERKDCGGYFFLLTADWTIVPFYYQPFLSPSPAAPDFSTLRGGTCVKRFPFLSLSHWGGLSRNRGVVLLTIVTVNFCLYIIYYIYIYIVTNFLDFVSIYRCWKAGDINYLRWTKFCIR